MNKKKLISNEIPNLTITPTALLIIDMTGEYLDSKYPGYVPNTSRLPEKINEIRKHLKSQLLNNYLEIFTVDCLRQYTKCLLNYDETLISNKLINTNIYLNTKRISIHPFISMIGDQLSELIALSKLVPNLFTDDLFILEKASERSEYSGFGGTFQGRNLFSKGKTFSTLHRILQARKIKRVYVVGLAYQKCVLYTAADAAYLGYETFMVQNGSNSAVITLDKNGKKIPDDFLVDGQKYEIEKVIKLINNKYYGLPGKNKEVLKVVDFNGKGFDEVKCQLK